MNKTCKNGHVNPQRNKYGACIPCQIEYHKKYNKDYQSRKRVQNKTRRDAHKAKALEYLGGKCLDCGNNDHRVLVFDHLNDKVDNVSRLLGKKWDTVQKELDKCELVCANCHKIRTDERIPSPIDTFKGYRASKPERTHCRHGHELTEENTYHYRNQRHCRICRRLSTYARRKRSKLSLERTGQHSATN